MALEAKKRGMKVIAYGSAGETGDKTQPYLQRKEPLPVGRYRSGFLRSPGRRFRSFEEPLRQGRSFVYIEFRHNGVDDHHHRCRDLADRGVNLYIHPSAQRTRDTTAHERLDAAIAEYQRKVKCL